MNRFKYLPFYAKYFGKLTEPANKLILRTALEQWRTILTVLFTAIFAALSEGLTLAIIFLAVDVLTNPQKSLSLSLPGLPSFGFPLSGFSLVILLMGCAVIVQGLQSVMRYTNKVSAGYFAARCRALIMSLMHRHLLGFTFQYSSKYKVGELTHFVNNAPYSVQIQIDAISEIVVNSIIAFVYILALIFISPWLLLAAMMIALVVSSLQKFLDPKIRFGAQRRLSIEKKISSRSTEDFQALRLLHSSGQLDNAASSFNDLMKDAEVAFRLQLRRLSLLEPVSSFLPIFAIALIVSASIFLLGDKSTDILPSLVTFVLALQRLNSRIIGLSGTFNILAENSAPLALTNNVLSKADKRFRRISGTIFTPPLSIIELKNVGLKYEEDLAPALIDFNLSIRPGETVALVGASGAGKSTVADLITGLFDPTSGDIYINGRSLMEIDPSSWQSSLGVVSQDTFLFNATILDNLLFGLTCVSRGQVKAAAQKAQASGFIEALPMGYDTVVGERGYRLSGGQRQRLSLARAFLRRPDLLILDEATSALDTESERLVQEAIQNVESRTAILVIAHRLSTVVSANHIVVMDKGRIVERGSHAELLSLSGKYSRLWGQQSLSL